MRAALQRAWLRRGPLARLLLPLSLLMRGIVALRRALYGAGVLGVQPAPVPVVVVGNVVAGGAGKTPVVIAIAKWLSAQGWSVGVVSRGHGRTGTACLEVRADSDPSRSGDEPLLVARRASVPVFVATRRADAVHALLQAHPGTQVILSDDGLQHYAMARDIEICVFDERGTGNGWLLPAGPLREPWPRRADLVLRTRDTRGIDGFVVQRRLASHAIRADGARRPLRELASSTCDALAGTAQPQRFFDMLAAAGVPLRRTWALPDHHDFAGAAPGWRDSPTLLCTEKDAVKLWRVRPDAWAVPLEVDIEPAFWDRLQLLLRPKLSSAHGPETA